MKPKLRVNTYVSKPGYQKFVTRYDHKLEGYDQIVKFAGLGWISEAQDEDTWGVLEELYANQLST